MLVFVFFAVGSFFVFSRSRGSLRLGFRWLLGSARLSGRRSLFHAGPCDGAITGRCMQRPPHWQLEAATRRQQMGRPETGKAETERRSSNGRRPGSCDMRARVRNALRWRVAMASTASSTASHAPPPTPLSPLCVCLASPRSFALSARSPPAPHAAAAANMSEVGADEPSRAEPSCRPSPRHAIREGTSA